MCEITDFRSKIIGRALQGCNQATATDRYTVGFKALWVCDMERTSLYQVTTGFFYTGNVREQSKTYLISVTGYT